MKRHLLRILFSVSLLLFCVLTAGYVAFSIMTLAISAPCMKALAIPQTAREMGCGILVPLLLIIEGRSGSFGVLVDGWIPYTADQEISLASNTGEVGRLRSRREG